jgi:trimethylamine--corrinoid protein Co-methyltransferase
LPTGNAVGAKVVDEMVYLDRGLVRDLIATIPADFTYAARNPRTIVRLGGRNSIFVPMTGAPYLRDLDDVRRNPTLDDLAMFHKLSHMLPSDAFLARIISSSRWTTRSATGTCASPIHR